MKLNKRAFSLVSSLLLAASCALLLFAFLVPSADALLLSGLQTLYDVAEPVLGVFFVIVVLAFIIKAAADFNRPV